MASENFKFLQEDLDQEDDSNGFPPAGGFNEYGEIEDDETVGDNQVDVSESFEESIDSDGEGVQVLDPSSEATQLAVVSNPGTNSSSSYQPWMKRSKFAPLETDREYLLFNTYLLNQGGRSLTCMSRVSNLGVQTLQKISVKNSWRQRAEEYDRYVLVNKLKQAETKRHEEHLKKLEQYRQDQESLGQQMTLNAARIAFLSSVTLEKMLTSEKELEIRDMPAMLNTAAKLAEVGKTLQSSALGVDNLLSAIEDSEQG